MKQFQLTLILVFACLGAIYAQTSNMEGRQWAVVNGPFMNSPDIFTHTYKTEGIVEVDGKFYSRLWIDSHSQGVWNPQGNLFREDSLKSIYHRWESGGEEWLYCDFTVMAGDTVTTKSIYSEECVGVVDSVDFIQALDGSMRKRILFEPRYEYDGNYYWENSWIEGAGSAYGPQTPYVCFTDYDAWLLCYLEGDEQVLGPLGNCIIVSDERVPAAQAPVLYPNPTSDVVRIETSQRISSTEIWSAQGARLQYVEGDWTELSLNPYAPGIYLFRIRYTDGSEHSTRVIRIP